jgi:CRISPR-associated protein Cas2
MGTEIQTLVVYDIEKDRIRNRISETCKDYGLERIQMSAFLGKLDRAMRRELFARLVDVLEATPGRILLVPICGPDFESRMEHVIQSEGGGDEKEEKTDGRPAGGEAVADGDGH